MKNLGLQKGEEDGEEGDYSPKKLGIYILKFYRKLEVCVGDGDYDENKGKEDIR